MTAQQPAVGNSAETRGLDATQVEERRSRHGTNEIATRSAQSVWSRILAQLRDPMIMLLLAAAAVTIAVGDMTDTAVIALVVVVNSAIGVVQEIRADRAIAELGRLAAPVAHVYRDGELQRLPAVELVPDDVVAMDAGDVVPADVVVLSAHALQLDESAMTGESQPADRTTGEELDSGTVVTRGRATARVVRTGRASGLGRIAELIAAAGIPATPLQLRLRRLSRELVWIVLVAAAVVFVLGVLRGRGVTEMLVTAVSLAVAAVPESLPAVVSVSLALGAHRMARRAALVRRLPAVETLGSVTVLASDKTGTLTEGRMVATSAWVPTGRQYDVTGVGYAPEGEVRPATATGETAAGHPEARDEEVLARLLRACVLCNDARLLPPDPDGDEGRPEWDAAGDPLEAALLVLAEKGGVPRTETRLRWRRVSESPFAAERGWMSTTHQCPDGRLLHVRKGAPEAVLLMVTAPGSAQVVAAARRETDRMAAIGCRVLAFAESDPTAPENDRFRLLGLVGVTDPPREASRAVVDACAAAGVRVVLVTGDHPVTAGVIARQVGIAEPDAVYARIRPEEKVRIVRELQERGEVVAMTGDGVNDAPALRAADIGVAMGRGGTEVARQAADLVLADDNLHTVVVAVEEGRRVYANIRNFLRYAVSGGAAEVAVMLTGPFLGMPLPLLPAQILWINMLTHGLPGVAFGAEPGSPALMERPSRSPRESVLGGGLGTQIAAVGGLIALVSLTAGLVADTRGEHVQTAIFLTLGLAQLGVALALRARVRRTWRRRGLELAVLAAAGLQLAGVGVPVLRELLGTHPVDGGELLRALLLAVVPGIVVTVTVRLADRRRAGRLRTTGPRQGPSDPGPGPGAARGSSHERDRGHHRSDHRRRGRRRS